MLMRSACRSLGGSGSGAGGNSSAIGSGGGSAGAGGASTAGCVAQPAIYKKIRRPTVCPTLLVTDANSQYFYIRLFQTVAQPVEFIKIIGRSNAYAMVGIIIDRNPLYA